MAKPSESEERGTDSHVIASLAYALARDRQDPFAIAAQNKLQF
jgi:hypothetical protein